MKKLNFLILSWGIMLMGAGKMPEAWGMEGDRDLSEVTYSFGATKSPFILGLTVLYGEGKKVNDPDNVRFFIEKREEEPSDENTQSPDLEEDEFNPQLQQAMEDLRDAPERVQKSLEHSFKKNLEKFKRENPEVKIPKVVEEYAGLSLPRGALKEKTEKEAEKEFEEAEKETGGSFFQSYKKGLVSLAGGALGVLLGEETGVSQWVEEKVNSYAQKRLGSFEEATSAEKPFWKSPKTLGCLARGGLDLCLFLSGVGLVWNLLSL